MPIRAKKFAGNRAQDVVVIHGVMTLMSLRPASGIVLAVGVTHLFVRQRHTRSKGRALTYLGQIVGAPSEAFRGTSGIAATMLLGEFQLFRQRSDHPL